LMVIRLIAIAITIAIFCSVPFTTLQAHEVRPGYLELQETNAESFDVMWKVPARGNLRLSISPLLPDNCEATSRVVTRTVGGSFSDRWTVNCSGGLAGQSIYIEGLSGTLTDTLVRISLADGTSRVARLTPAKPSFLIPATPTWTQTAVTYLGLGVEHILRGIDHLLFVLALLLLVQGWRQVVTTITAFTIAHSLTLAAATLGFVHVPQRPVEAVIALSIVLVAAEVVRRQQGKRSIAQQWPWAIAFTFGLLHGFGFAGALTEIGLPQQAIPLALLFFNVGVELGQILFIAGAIALYTILKPALTRLPRTFEYAPAYAIGIVAAFWTAERITGFLV
jgi:hydrogenase/urease accessory protein HupE